MAHELDITDGKASFANSRNDAWHRLGQSVGHTMTAREALDAAHLAGWNVRKMPLQVPQAPVIDDNGVTTPAPLAVPDFYATVRTNPINGRLDVLGVVGTKYEPVQNEASCNLLDALVDESGGAHFETAGALRGGRETFVTMKLPNSMVFDGKDGSKDATTYFLAALNSHDGSSKFRFGAAASLREGLDETLTVLRLGMPPTLARTLRSTNCIESMISVCREHAGNVKRWRDGQMALRWCAAGMVEAGKQFRRVNGHLHLPTLRTALERQTAEPVGPVVHNDKVSAA